MSTNDSRTEQASKLAAGEHAEIAPLELDFSAIDAASDQTTSASTAVEKASPPWLLPAVLGLALLAALVIFMLPKFVGNEVAPVQEASQVTVPEADAPVDNSPWQEAQQAKFRQAAQHALEPLLERQAELETLGVQQWAADEFAGLVALALQGDKDYRQQRYEAAANSYTQALSSADELLASVPQRLAAALAAGLEAIERDDAPAAESAFNLAQVFEPDNAAALDGLARVAVMDQVRAALTTAEQLEAQGELESALQALRKVLELDADRRPALQPRITVLETSVLEAQFAQHMSDGYRRLDQGNESSAMKAFSLAQGLKPNALEPKKALNQVRGKRKLSQMTVHFDRAANFERNENWAGAVTEFQSALAIDANLSDAKTRLSYATQRHKMDQALLTLNGDPLRLADPTIYQKAIKIHAAGSKAKPLGPKLRSQLTSLQGHLQDSQSERRVMIQSDGLTKVTVQRVANLGTLAEKALTLRPGRYVAMGVREGYRDVRKEFVVPLEARDLLVEVRCVEPI